MIAATRPAWVGGDQPDPGQAAGDQVAEEREPAGAVLAGGDLHTQHLAVAVGIDTGRDKGVDRHNPATLTHLQHQRVRGHERERAGLVEAAGAELFDVGVEVLFSLLQKNVLNRHTWATREELRIAIVTWIERTYHRRRRQHGLGRLTPIEYETIMTTTANQAA